MTRNQLQFFANQEIERANRVREIETQRSNQAQERLKAKDQDLKIEDQKLTKRGQNISMINTGIQTVGKLASSFVPSRGSRTLGSLTHNTSNWSSMSDSQKRDMINKF